MTRWTRACVFVLGACGDSAVVSDGGTDAGITADAGATPDAGPAFTGDPRCAPLYDAMMTLAAEHGAPGGGFALVLDGQLVCTVPWGIERADMPDVPVTEDTIFRISHDWMILALTTLELAALGELDLDARVRDIVGDLDLEPAAWADEIRVQHLLWKTSGIPAEAATFSLIGPPCDESGPSLDAYYANVDHGGRVMWGRPPTPSSTWAPASSVLLARVIATAAGEPYADVVRRVLFEPLGLTNAHVGWSAELDAQRVYGHRRAGAGFVQPLDSPLLSCEAAQASGGNVALSLRDAARLLAIVSNGGRDAGGTRLLAESTVDAFMQSRAQSEWWGSLGQAAGGDSYERRSMGSQTSWGQAGGGYSASWVTGQSALATPDFAVIELVNLEYFRFIHQLTSIQANELGWPFPTRDGADPAAADVLTPEQLAEYAGRYVSPMGCDTIDIAVRDGALYATRAGLEIAVYSEGRDRFRIGLDHTSERASIWREPGTPGAISTLLVPGTGYAYYPEARVPPEIAALSTCP